MAWGRLEIRDPVGEFHLPHHLGLCTDSAQAVGHPCLFWERGVFAQRGDAIGDSVPKTLGDLVSGYGRILYDVMEDGAQDGQFGVFAAATSVITCARWSR